MTTLLALDGNSLLHRAYHAYSASAMTNSAEEPVWAVYGFMALFNGILEKVDPGAVLVAFDDPDDNRRKEQWPEYKAQRSDKPSELIDQMDAVQRLLADAGFAVQVSQGWEADDVVASAAAAASQRGWKTVVATSDRDAFSLVDDDVTVLRLVSGLDNAVEVTPAKLVEMYGITPHQYLDYAAMRGDKSDNLPGVAGVGAKTAAKVLQHMGSVRAALDDRDATVAALGAFAERLFNGVAEWERNVKVMAQRRDLEVDLDATVLEVLEDAQVAAALKDFELPKLVGRFARTLSDSTPRSARAGRGRAAGPPQAPPPSGPGGDARRPGGGQRSGGAGGGLPAREESTPTVSISGVRVSTTGGSPAPRRMPLTIK